MAHDLYKKVEQFVVASFNNAGKSSQVKHFLRTVHWVRELRPGADEALLISAVAHDIERAFRQEDVVEKKHSVGFVHLDFLRPHEERGAEIVCDFLRHQGAADELIMRVMMLVSRHEEGGNDDQNLLKDADSISHFETTASSFILKRVDEMGKDRVREKIEWMFKRITSGKARQIVKPWYEKALSTLR